MTALVDDSPPTLNTTVTDGTRLDAWAKSDDPSRWYITLSGTVSDPVIPGTSTAGSGVPSDGVQVTIYEAGGGLAGPKDQTATLSGSNWSIDYPLSDRKPGGCYTLHVEAVDALARTPGLDATQVARHTASLDRSVGINASGPAVQVDRLGLAGNRAFSTTTTLSGVANSRTVPVKVAWETGDGGAGAALTVTCAGPGASESHTPYAAIAGAYDASASYSWADQVRRQASCTVHMTAAGGTTGIVSGTVSACGVEVASWRNNSAADYTVSFAADSSACQADTCSGQVASAGVGKVELAFTPLQPGSTFVNETAPAGEVLHLAFDEGFAATPGVFRNIAPSGLAGTCSGTTCPSAGQAGHDGLAALFNPPEEVNDAVQVASFGSFTTPTVSAWVRRTGNTGKRETIVSYKESGSCGFVLGLNEENSQYPRFWVRYQPPGGAAAWANIYDAQQVPLDTWVHLVGTYDGTTLKLYRDGQLVKSAIAGTAGGAMVQCTGTTGIGARNSLDMHYFPGLIDDVRIFGRALSDSELMALQRGSGPQLKLDFEQAVISGGDLLADGTSWGRAATLNTGAGDVTNKAVSGQVGSYALQLDGVDDYAVIPDDDAIDFDANHDFAVAAWIKPAPAQVWTATVDNNVIEKWSSAGGYPYSIRYLNQTAGANAGKISAGRWDGQNGPWLQSTTRIDDGRFHHVAFVKSGSTLALYVDGVLDGQRTDTTTGTTTNSSPLYISWRGGTSRYQGYFTGSVDDVRLYPVALPAEEIRGMYLEGWRPATLAASGVTVHASGWTLPIPAGLEGSYRVDLRANDNANHSWIAPIWSGGGQATPTWSGELDSTPPRMTLCKALVSGTTYRYVTLAQDYNLVETGFTTPCGVGRHHRQRLLQLALVPERHVVQRPEALPAHGLLRAGRRPAAGVESL